jgi:hypothetical protein
MVGIFDIASYLFADSSRQLLASRYLTLSGQKRRTTIRAVGLGRRRNSSANPDLSPSTPIPIMGATFRSLHRIYGIPRGRKAKHSLTTQTSLLPL